MRCRDIFEMKGSGRLNLSEQVHRLWRAYMAAFVTIMLQCMASHTHSYLSRPNNQWG